MMDPCKRLKIKGHKRIDRLTDLPIDIKHQIQEKLPVDEAAKMSVLSRPWRHVWASIPNLVFSTEFCRRKPTCTLIDIVSKILLQHDGAIKTFVMNISSINCILHCVIDKWMFLLSRNGLMNLTLHKIITKTDYPYKLPSYMCSVELEKLDLFNCIIRSPCSFRGFHKLKSLLLHHVTLELNDVAASLLSMPNLVILQIKTCIGLDHLKIYAPKLMKLSIFNDSIRTLKLERFIDCPKLETVALGVKNHQENEVMNLTYLLNNWPEVNRLRLDSYYLKSFASDIEAERLPTCLTNLRVLTPFGFDFDDGDQILSILRMLRTCPNLENLLFTFTERKKGGTELVDANHFEELAYMTQGLELNKLKNLKIENFHGSRTELLFVRFILASAPLLQKTILRVDESQCQKIRRVSMRFPRASPKLEIICEPSKPELSLEDYVFRNDLGF